MANASTKRIAASNESALRNLQLGLLVVNSGTWILRYLISLITQRSFFPRTFPLILYILSTGASLFVWRWFVTIGTPIRTGGDIKVGDDLNGKGIIELAWDLIYMSWICSIGSAIFGNKVWYLLLLIPGFGLYKLFNVIRPFLGMFLPGLFGPKRQQEAGAGPGAGAEQGEEKAESRKQAKLRARMEKGDKRIQQVQRKQG